MLTQEYLKELLKYDPKTGSWTWLVNKNRARKGAIAGTINEEGYRKIRIDGRKYLASRLAFLYMIGKFPAEQVDHIDGSRNDTWSNLREATHAQNIRNRGRQKNNTSGHRGVSYFKPRGTWKVDVGRKTIGYFKDFADAATAYNLAAYLKYGEFYRRADHA